jgi:TonB-linked SusC/RagA family outer membrane protein
VQVYLQGTSHGALTGQGGRFTLSDVEPGSYTVVAQRIGYQESRSDVNLAPGATVTVNLTLAPAVLALQEVVATGLIDPVEGVRSPITVGVVTREMMPVVSAGSAVENLQGRIAGVYVNRGSGQPGEGTNIMLRTPTSVTQAGNPMIVVDGVILGEDNTTNIESLDIESMEVIKGAAAASLYGSRAAAGVIAITTNRGRNLEAGETRFSARTEMGFTEPVRDIDMPTHHHYLVDNAANPSTYVDAEGNPVDREERESNFFSPGIAFMDTPYPGPIFDNVGTVFNPGNFMSHSFSVAQNGIDTNFALSLNRRVEQGALENNSGYTLTSFRLNLDHRFLETLALGVSAYHSRDDRDNVIASFEDILASPADVDLGARDENGEFVRVLPSDITYNNPIWEEGSQDDDRQRARTLASANLRWSPISWFTASGNVSYDRSDTERRRYIALGTPITEEGSEGDLRFNNDIRDTWNAEAQASLRRDFGPLNVRTTVRSLLEVDSDFEREARGRGFLVGGVPDLDAAENQTSDSEASEVKSVGYLWDTAFDYAGKYIFTGLLRRDGSSLFGPDNRWHNYYRVAASYRLAEEPWFNIPNVDEFKLSYARGTAGGRPPFDAQYETWEVSNTGPSKDNLGNRELRPEHTTEQEVSLDVILFNRFSVDVTHAWQRTTNQLVLANLPSILGYGGQWSNGGTVSGHTTELAIEASLYRTENFDWSTTFVADRSRGKIEDWPFACENPTWRYRCDGVGIYEVWGGHFIRSPSELAGHHTGVVAEHADEFQVNDDGYLVWVGEGNNYTEGISKDLWGTSTTIDGREYRWGMPFLEADELGAGERQKIGDSSHTNFGWLNNFRFGQFSLHAHLHAAIGGDAINRTYQELVVYNRAPEMDQGGKAEGDKKPIAYYTALEGGTGNDAWMEDGDYLKLRTVSLNYRLTDLQLRRFGLGALGMESMTLGLIGRNMLTITGYSGFDPEQALDFGNRQNQDRFSYPNTRNYTAEVQVTF